MTAGVQAPCAGNRARSWPVIAGLLLLYVPTYLSLMTGAWTVDRNAHGPFVLACVLYIFWKQWNRIQAIEPRPRPVSGGILFGLGLLLYILGRSQDALVLEVGSQIPVLIGVLLIMISGEAVRRLWFPLVFLLFLIPLPGALVDALTLPLKHYVSVAVDQLLYWSGYPIARSGVVLTIGPYQVLIADACSGLKSMYSLSALGIFYVYLRRHASILQNALLLGSVIPIALFANIGRVIALVLITYYFGDEAGQGFLHDLAGYTELVVALIAFGLLDSFLGLVIPGKTN